MRRWTGRARASGGTLWRMLDANANRAREGLRVAEDVLRFIVGSARLSGEARRLRHAIGAAAEEIAPRSAMLKARDSSGDAGSTRWRAGRARGGASGLLAANLRRAQESVRVLEECARLVDKGGCVRRMQSLRYSLYDLEARAGSALRGGKAPE